MADYRDYGAIRGATAPQVAVNTKKLTQVYLATHDGSGNRLPYMNRSFISFSYGGKLIEDFNLVASIENNSLNRQGYASFSDNVTTSDIYDGQLYWSTHYTNNQIDFSLATDGITEEQLNNFLYWFQPGKQQELILVEHPNRAILARVLTPPVLNLLPFEETANIAIAGNIFKTSTTLYKGTISLSLIMDDPFWYSKVNILDYKDEDGHYITPYWKDANGRLQFISNSADALKIILEDHVPETDMFININNTNNDLLFGNEDMLSLDLSSGGAAIGYARIGQARIGYNLIYADAGLTLLQSTPQNIYSGYCFYGGNAPCAPILSFALTPKIDSSTKYISCPNNSFTNSSQPYNTITLESINKREFKFTTPGIYTGYNQVVNILSTVGAGVAWEDVRNYFRDHVKHFAPRAYIISVMDNTNNLGDVTSSEKLSELINQMPKFLYASDSSTTIAPTVFTIDNKTGQATALVSYRHSYSAQDYLLEVAENVGDMVYSGYLLLTDRNNFTEDGYVGKWTTDHPDYSYRIYTDVDGGLSNVSLRYKYLYL